MSAGVILLDAYRKPKPPPAPVVIPNPLAWWCQVNANAWQWWADLLSPRPD